MNKRSNQIGHVLIDDIIGNPVKLFCLSSLCPVDHNASLVSYKAVNAWQFTRSRPLHGHLKQLIWSLTWQLPAWILTLCLYLLDHCAYTPHCTQQLDQNQPEKLLEDQKRVGTAPAWQLKTSILQIQSKISSFRRTAPMHLEWKITFFSLSLGFFFWSHPFTAWNNRLNHQATAN